jgi:hypothetical protein
VAESDQNPAGDGKSQPPVSDGDKSKLFFGKYKTIEEAEAGYKELERGFHSKAQEASQWKQIADRPAARPANLTSNTVPASDPSQELTEFYSNPVGWKKKLVQQTKEELRHEQEEQQRQVAETSARLNAWGVKNPDLSEHGALLETYVRRTDPRLDIETRLDLAANETRKYLTSVRGQGRTSNPDPNTMDGQPGSSRGDQGGSGNAAAPVPASDGESQLASYASERNKGRMKRPGTHK